MTAAPLKVSREQRAELERMAVSTSLPHRVVVRTSALLLAADGEAIAVIARECSTTPDTHPPQLRSARLLRSTRRRHHQLGRTLERQPHPVRLDQNR